MKTKKVVVLPYDEAWQNEFEAIKDEIESAIGDVIVAIEHVGSTAVRGMSAKLYPDNIDKYIEYKSPLVEELYAKCGLK